MAGSVFTTTPKLDATAQPMQMLNPA